MGMWAGGKEDGGKGNGEGGKGQAGMALGPERTTMAPSSSNTDEPVTINARARTANPTNLHVCMYVFVCVDVHVFVQSAYEVSTNRMYKVNAPTKKNHAQDMTAYRHRHT